MAYIIGQYNKSLESDNDTMHQLNGTVGRIDTSKDSEQESYFKFYDECLRLGEGLQTSRNYYFHGKIKRLASQQNFYVKLGYYDRTTTEREIEQYIKTINIASGNTDDWVDVEFLFNPLEAFDCLIFELQRNKSDYQGNTRYPIIMYQELSYIDNIIGTGKVQNAEKLIKLGVQSRPGLLMCINGEEIRTSRVGIYEIKNGIITASFFSVVKGAVENGTEMAERMAYINSLDLPYGEEDPDYSTSFLNTDKTRKIDAFTLDYMFKQNT